MENEKCPLFDLEYGDTTKNYGKWENHTWNIARKTEKRGKGEMLALVPGIWQENWKAWKMRKTHCMRWNIGKNHWKMWKMRNTHSVGPGVRQEKWKSRKMRKTTVTHEI